MNPKHPTDRPVRSDRMGRWEKFDATGTLDLGGKFSPGVVQVETKLMVITGAPGSGKTTLADLLPQFVTWQVSRQSTSAETVAHLEEFAQASTVVVVDQAEMGIHPMHYARFIKRLRAIDKRAIITTSSLYLLGCCTWDEVWVVDLHAPGDHSCRPLGDHPDAPDAEKWRSAMDPGEFLATAGFSWPRQPTANKAVGT